jgi:uncharacterized protein (DUF58 family)
MTISLRVVLILLAVCLLAGASTGNQVYYQLSYLWGFLLVGSWIWSQWSVRGVSIVRSARTLRAQVGQVFEERFEVTNHTRLPRLWLEVRDESSLPGSEGSRVMMLIESRQGRSYLARTRLLERGAFSLGPTVIASGDLFGLFPATITTPPHESLLVYPMMVDVEKFPNPQGLLSGGEALRRRTPHVTPNASGVRDYVHGDPLSRIHWLSSARRNKLIVKEFELDPLADIWIFVDGDASMRFSKPRPPVDYRISTLFQKGSKVMLPPDSGEYAISAAASLARYYLRRSRAVGLVAVGQFTSLIPPDRGGRQLGKILEALSLLKMEGDSPLRGLVETQAKHITRGSTVVVITSSVSEDTVLIFDHLQRRGLRPIAVLADAFSFGGPDGSARIAGQLRGMGIPVRTLACDQDLAVSLAV